LASCPPLVKFANPVVGSSSNATISQASTCRSISLAIGACGQAASCGLYNAASVSATTPARRTVGLNSPK